MERRLVLAVAVLVSAAFLLSSAAVAQQPPSLVPGSLLVRALADKKVARLPVGRPGLYWRLESFPSGPSH
jgi:hypothetical protein